MALKVRRVVIGYNADGKAVVKTDEQLGAVSIDAKPPEVNGKILGAVFPSFPGQRKGDKQ